MDNLSETLKQAENLIENKVVKKIFGMLVIPFPFVVAYMLMKRMFIIVIGIIFFIIFVVLGTIDIILSLDRFKKSPKNKKGILVIIDAQDEKEYNEIKFKFFNNLVDKLRFESENIKLVLVEYKLNNKAQNLETNKLLKKTRCKFVLKIRECHEIIKEDMKYRIYLDLVGYSKSINNLINKCENIFVNKKIDFSKLDKIDMLEITSEDIALLVKYMLTYLYVLEENYKECQNILMNLENSLDNKVIMRNKRLGVVKISVILLSYVVSYIIAIKTYEEYVLNGDFKLLDEIERQLENANSYISDTYSYAELKSIIRFLKYRDVEYGIQVYKSNKYKNILCVNKKFNLAFLEAYKDSSEIRVANLYHDSFKTLRKNKIDDSEYITDIIEFIERNINESEYANTKLNLALALLYIEIDNIEKFKENLKKYMKSKNILKINPFVTIMIENRYGIELEKMINGFDLN